MTAAELLAENIKRLGAQAGITVSAPNLEKVAKRKGRSVTRSSVGRCLAGDGNPSLGFLEELAGTLGAETWELLHPAGTEAAQPTPTLTLSQGLKTILAALEGADADTKKLFGGLLANLAENPQTLDKVLIAARALLSPASQEDSKVPAQWQQETRANHGAD